MESRVLAKRIEMVPSLDQHQVSFAESTGLFEGLKGEIDFAKALVGDDKSHLRNAVSFGEFLELGQAYASFVELTGTSVSMNEK
jgi:hypothetical protein